jgi:ZipA, C-terminal FtsZ-binding domain
MNSLQAGLIGVSVLVIALFAAWMWWQSWRNAREEQARVAHRNAAAQRSADLPARSDPTLAVDTALQTPQSNPSSRVHGVAVATDTETMGHIDKHTDFEVPQPSQPVANAPIDGATAAALFNTATVTGAPGARGELVSAVDAAGLAPKTSALPTTLPLDDRLHVYARISPRDGQAIDCNEFADLGDRTLAWGRVFKLSAWEAIEDPTNGGAVQELCLGLPIASRAGPLADGDALAWKRAVSAIADRVGLDVQFGGDLGVGERASELDQFLAAADVICVLYLVRKDGGHWSGTRLRGTLEANGFRLQADGRFVYFEVESESPIFSAVDGFERSFTPERLRTENVTALRLVFEASNVVNPVARFDVYRQTLRALARLLESDIKDGSGGSVGDTEFAALRAEVVAGSQALAEAGIECGSATAHALFR